QPHVTTKMFSPEEKTSGTTLKRRCDCSNSGGGSSALAKGSMSQKKEAQTLLMHSKQKHYTSIGTAL
ncbi:MAG: hypothetical protein QXD70_05040, partial [Candidatus Bathyarchaeia archaeon]